MFSSRDSNSKLNDTNNIKVLFRNTKCLSRCPSFFFCKCAVLSLFFVFHCVPSLSQHKSRLKTLWSFVDWKSRSRRYASSLASDEEHEAWDAPLQRHTVPWATSNQSRTKGAYHYFVSPNRAGSITSITRHLYPLENGIFSHIFFVHFNYHSTSFFFFFFLTLC